MKTKWKKTALLSALGVCVFSGVFYIHSVTRAKTVDRKFSFTKPDFVTIDDHAGRIIREEDITETILEKGITFQKAPNEKNSHPQKSVSSFENRVVEDKARGNFKEAELRETISNGVTFEENTSVNEIPINE